ncbi:SusC/RagA family TonB-linked outer membrane protein [Sphingobacterium tabacisoli]|uniref:SusC/RagA family TonB-linked outer membrane protein n=1 Tax=Sphingobacterium tabacisoli TaxID=2044855 RepID=A0ABW5KWD3_9SPHI|nr:SusC/RagA family TonB-linked outer membrane protein [Sphingobacterium tabacisoli]
MKISLNPFLQNGKEGLSLHGPTPGTRRTVFDGNNKSPNLSRPLSRSLMKINLITLLLGLGLSQVDASTYAQQVTLKRQKTNLEAILKDFEKQSGYTFFYNKTDIAPVKGVDVDVKNMPLNQALNSVLKNGNFTFEYFDKTIVIKKGRVLQPQSTSREFPQSVSKIAESVLQQVVRGLLLDENGKPIKGASVRLKSDPKLAVATQEDGSFNLPITSLNEILVISYLGYESREVKASLERNRMIIRLKKQEEEVGEVVVTGITQRKKESFTGATASFTGQELKMVNNQNVVASLRALDPSFIQIENNALGSNPNMLPKIELRGQTSIPTSSLKNEFSTDPNQPLFILDGFETSLRTIMDLDMNIIQSATILKDAASTAIYGSRASNGVVVIETIKPKPGKVQLSYSADMQVQAPDLSSYNMMDAAEKLEFERLSGRFYANQGNVSQQLKLDQLYNDRLDNVLRGVNTYWLDKPLQTGFSHRHSVSARGGEGAVVFDVGMNYKNTKGAIKLSGREDWGANINLSYRTGKLNVSNRAYISGYTGNESPYGSFSTWVNTNPYFELLPADEMYLSYKTLTNDSRVDITNVNPLYNASLKSFDKTKNYLITDNLQFNYDFTSALRLTAGGQISKGNTTSDAFLSSLHSKFAGVDYSKRGSLDHAENSYFSYTGNLMLTYAKIISDVHSITANFRGEVNETVNQSNGYTAVGFPSTSNGNPAFSNGFVTDSKPVSYKTKSRRNSVLGSINYSYAQKYNLDFNYNLDGSTSFGSNNLYSPYYSFGLGWNLDKEDFIKKISWVNMFRLRGNIGVTGNQNFGNVSQSVYSYVTDLNRFGEGIYLSALGAPDLKWQRTRQTSVGLDAVLFNNKLNVQVNAYDKLTDPLVVAVTLPSSTGLSAYPFNAGTLNYKGIETTVNYSPIYNPVDRIVLTFGLTGSMLKSHYDNFNNKLSALNQEMRESNSLTRYKDGYGPNDIWAVRSLGIDPSSGREVFLTSNGEQTYNYDPDNIVKVGTAQPLAEGVLRGSLTYKGFTANVLLRYIFRKDNLNTALFNKVENISLKNVENNQDKRALYDRWQKPGDISQFKAISITNTTPISSRFVQKENTFSGESISLGYEFRDQRWLDGLKLSNLRINTFFNDIFYSSTVRRERGIDYPFTKNVSMSIYATFK